MNLVIFMILCSHEVTKGTNLQLQGILNKETDSVNSVKSIRKCHPVILYTKLGLKTTRSYQNQRYVVPGFIFSVSNIVVNLSEFRKFMLNNLLVNMRKRLILDILNILSI